MSYVPFKRIIGDKQIYGDTFFQNAKNVPSKIMLKKQWLETAEETLGQKVNGLRYSINDEDGRVELRVELTPEEGKNKGNYKKINYSSKQNKLSRYVYIANDMKLLEFFSQLPYSGRKDKNFCKVLVDGNNMIFKKEKVYSSEYHQNKIDIHKDLRKRRDIEAIQKIIDDKSLTDNQRVNRANRLIYEFRMNWGTDTKIDYL